MHHSPAAEDTRPSRSLRIALPALVCVLWMAVMGIGGPQFGAISEVSTNDQASFLPASAESTQVQQQLTAFQGERSVPAVVVFTGDGAHPDALRQLPQTLAEDLPNVQFSPIIGSSDGKAAQMVAAIPSDADVKDSVDTLDARLNALVPDTTEHWITGPAGFTADLAAAFAGIDGQLLLVTVLAVLVVLIAVYRSPLLPLMVLLSALAALCMAVAIDVALARQGLVTLNGQVQGILFILVIGAATDYGLLYTARYREELRRHRHRWDATLAAIKGTWEPIAASAATVIAGLLCLMLSDLVSTAALGPVAAVGIASAVCTALSFLPAMLLLTGRRAFWPRPPTHDAEQPHHSDSTAKQDSATSGLWDRISGAVESRPRPLAAGLIVALGLGWMGLIGFQANGVPESEFVLGTSQARDGQEMLQRHFPGGSGAPVYVITPQEQLDSALETIDRLDGVGQPRLLSADSPSGTVEAEPGNPGARAESAPTVIDGRVAIQATLSAASDSAEAEGRVRELRQALPEAQVGGSTAINVDTNDTSIRDRQIIIPIVLVVITLMLAALLRSVVAPLVLLTTTILSFGTALGVSALIFRLLGFEGADPTVPLYGFVFLVALGIDYNIFLMTRVREEALDHGTRAGVHRGLVTTGGVITSAGVVLAATFAALAVIPIQFLVQLAIIVSLGVLIDALVVRSFLVPALSLWIGDRIWWPAHRRYPESSAAAHAE